MTDIEQLKLEFYQNGSAEAVLNRFKFSEEEEKLVRSAIQTSKMKKPRIHLIHKVDELLKEVAKTRTPIVKNTTTQEPIEVKLAMHSMQSNKPKDETKSKGIPFFYIPKTKLGRIIFFVMMAVLMGGQYFMVDSAQSQQDHFMQQQYDENKRIQDLMRGR